MKASKHILLIFTTLLFIACGNNSDQEGATEEHSEVVSEEEVSLTQEQYNTADIQIGRVSKRNIGDIITANGKLDVPPQQMVSVSIPIAGFVKKTSLLEGMHVKRGQVLAVLENLDYVQIQQDYLDVKSQYNYAEQEYKRQQQLAEEKVNAEKTLQQAKANYQSLQAKYKGLESKLKLMNIQPSSIEKGSISSTINVYAPISGYITEVNVNVGQYVSPKDVLFKIVNTEHLHVELTVFEKDVAKLEEEQPVRFTLANETTERTATVHLIGREISKDRTVRVHCHLDSEDSKLLPGMFLKAHIETNGAESYTLPESAIVKYEGKDYVYIEHSNHPADSMHHFEMTEVNVGSTDRGFTQIELVGKLDTNKDIVTRGGYILLAKMKNSDEEGHGH